MAHWFIDPFGNGADLDVVRVIRTFDGSGESDGYYCISLLVIESGSHPYDVILMYTQKETRDLIARQIYERLSNL